MNSIFLFVLIFSCQLVVGQVYYKVDSIGLWRDTAIHLDGYHNTYNEIWGFTVNEREYGVIGSKGGTYIVDIQEPNNPHLIQFIPGTYGAAINRDYHDYNGYLYMVCDQGASTLQIADLKYLPDSVHLIHNSDSIFSNCHNIFIDSARARLYACDVLDRDKKDIDLEIFDLSNSAIPQKLLSYNHPDIAAFHDIYVKNDTAFGNNGNSGLYIYDFTKADQPKIIGSLPEYSEKGFNHAGYATNNLKYYFFSDETKGKDLKSTDVGDLYNPLVVKLFNAGQNKEKIVAHNLLIKDSLLYVSYYHEGLQIYNISKPESPIWFGYYQTYTQTTIDELGFPVKNYEGFRGAWGVYPFFKSGNILVSDREKGIFIFKVNPNSIPVIKYTKGPLRLVYPNPILNYADLNYTTEQILQVDLFDDSGKLIQEDMRFEYTTGTSRIYFDDGLQAGMYILKVQTIHEMLSVRLIKE